MKKTTIVEMINTTVLINDFILQFRIFGATECFEVIVIASGGGLSPTHAIHTVRAIDGMTKMASATPIRIDKRNFAIKRNAMNPEIKNIKYAKINTYTPRIVFGPSGNNLTVVPRQSITRYATRN